MDDAATENNERELSRRDWFDEARRLGKENEELKADIRLLRSELRIANDTAALGVKMLSERDALLRITGSDHQDSLRAIGEATALSAAEPSAPIAKQERQLEGAERQRLIAWGRNCGLEEASKVCQRMTHEAYYPPGTRFKHFTPKAQVRLGDILIKAANAIGSLPDDPYERFYARQGNKS